MKASLASSNGNERFGRTSFVSKVNGDEQLTRTRFVGKTATKEIGDKNVIRNRNEPFGCKQNWYRNSFDDDAWNTSHAL